MMVSSVYNINEHKYFASANDEFFSLLQQTDVGVHLVLSGYFSVHNGICDYRICRLLCMCSSNRMKYLVGSIQAHE